VLIDKVTNLPADATCPDDYTAAFLDGTIPPGTCSRMSDSPQSIVDEVLGGGSNGTQPDSTGSSGQTPQEPKKPNIFKRLFGGGDKQSPSPAAPPQ
jgi:penicillin-binding protein 1B